MRVASLAAAAFLSGCGLWYRPVPIRTAIGRERATVAGDSFSVYREPRFEVYGPGGQSVFDAYEQMNRAYRAFDRYFGEPAPRIAVVLYREHATPDPGVELALRERGLTVLRFVRPIRAVYREHMGDEGYEGSLWPVGPIVARVLLASFVSPPGTLDTSALQRLPAWYRAGVMNLTGVSAELARDVETARELRNGKWTLEMLLSTDRAPSADSLFDPYRRDDVDERDRRFGSQSSAAMQFLVDREGAAVVRRLGRGFAGGATLASQLGDFKVLPRTLVELEPVWASWLASQKLPW